MGGKQSKQGTPPAQCCGDCAKPLPKRAEKGGGGTGEVVDVKGLPMYVVGKGPVSIIVAYDIFGFKENPRTREVCDEIASKVGARVVMPDFFRGEDVLQKFGSFPPPGGVPAVVEWFNSRAPFDKVIEGIDSIVIPYLKEQGACKAIGGVGFCWGGNVCIQGARKLKDLKAIAALHSNIQTKEDVADLDVPIALFQSGDDPKAASHVETLKDKPFYAKCVARDYPDMFHGWSLRADMSDAKYSAQANDVIQRTCDFFKAAM